MSKRVKACEGRITILVDNCTRRPELVAEHGLAVLLEVGGRRILFDTGQNGPTLKYNAHQLESPVANIHAVALSHGHYDHTGGLPAVLEESPEAEVYLHPGAVQPKFARRGRHGCRPVGMPEPALRILHRRGGLLRWTTEPTEVAPGTWLTGPIPRIEALEDTGGSFFLDPEGQMPDPLEDDQALWVQTGRGLLVVVGCAHAGVVNTLTYIQELAPAQQIAALIGGMHLLRADAKRLDRTAERLKALGVEFVGACHCTGFEAAAFLRERLPGRILELTAGSRLRWTQGAFEVEDD